MKTRSTVAVVSLLAFLGSTWSAKVRAEPENWDAAALGGGELNFAPELDQLTGHGWVGFDSRGRGIVGSGDLHLFYNTTKLHAGIDRLSFANGKLAFFAFVEGEALISQLLVDYFKRGERIGEFGFKSSYLLMNTKLQWYPGKHQTLELLVQARRWWFGARGNTSPLYALPPDTWVFEPRFGYNYWNIDVPAEEWEAQRVFPRIKGLAVAVVGKLDVRSEAREWGLDDDRGRNDPGRPIYGIEQSLRAGWQLAPLFRLQLQQWGHYGWGQDDITRQRIGGVNPYVIPVPGLPWPALLSERLLAGQLSLHIKAKQSSPHEFGLLVGGGGFNDVYRVGKLSSYGGAGGLALFGDLRFGPTGRYQLDILASWAFPANWLLEPPYLSGLLAFGMRIF